MSVWKEEVKLVEVQWIQLFPFLKWCFFKVFDLFYENSLWSEIIIKIIQKKDNESKKKKKNKYLMISRPNSYF